MICISPKKNWALILGPRTFFPNSTDTSKRTGTAQAVVASVLRYAVFCTFFPIVQNVRSHKFL